MIDKKIWNLQYNKPAKAWHEALPLGNGSMGAMVFGGIAIDRIDLNLDTLWSGDGRYKGIDALRGKPTQIPYS